MKTIAQILGEPDDPVVEAVRGALASGMAAIEHAIHDPAIGIMDIRRMEWKLAKQVVALVSRKQEIQAGDK